MRLMFVRHGEIWRPDDVYIDEEHVYLTERGRMQAGEIRSTIVQFDPEVVVISPVPRCVEFAERALSGKTYPVEYDARLRERCFPSLYGRRFDEIGVEFGSYLEQCLRDRGELVFIDGGESMAEAQARVLESVFDLSNRVNRAVVISHGGPHSWLCCHAFGIDLADLRRFSLRTGAYSVFECTNNVVHCEACDVKPVNAV